MSLGAQKNCHIETVLLSTCNISFGLEIRKIIFNSALLSEGLILLFSVVGTAGKNTNRGPVAQCP